MARKKMCVSVSISLPFTLLNKIDELANKSSKTRSEYIMETLEEKLTGDERDEETGQ